MQVDLAWLERVIVSVQVAAVLAESNAVTVDSPDLDVANRLSGFYALEFDTADTMIAAAFVRSTSTISAATEKVVATMNSK